MKLPGRSLERLVCRPVPPRKASVVAYLNGPLGRFIEWGLRWQFDDVEVLLISMNSVDGIFDTVTEQEQRLLEMCHVRRVQQIIRLISANASFTPSVHVEAHTRERLEE